MKSDVLSEIGRPADDTTELTRLEERAQRGRPAKQLVCRPSSVMPTFPSRRRLPLFMPSVIGAPDRTSARLIASPLSL
jgi:hypothetical protein